LDDLTMRSDASDSGRAGVTIIELMVALGIVALLMSLLLPAMSHVRKASKSTHASSNLRQLAWAAASYSNVNAGRYPPAILYEIRDGALATIAWDFVQLPSGVIQPGPLWSFTDQPGEIQQDPLFAGASTFGSDPFTGFNYNTTYLGAEGHMPYLGAGGQIVQGWDAARLGIPPDRFRQPDKTAVFGQGGWAGGANKFMRAPLNSVEGDLWLVYAGGQAFRAVGGTTIVAYLDGRVASVAQPRQGIHATPALLEQTMRFPHNGFLSDDDDAYDPD
jgi:type II secretory pathway pseudopilin PulG